MFATHSRITNFTRGIADDVSSRVYLLAFAILFIAGHGLAGAIEPPSEANGPKDTTTPESPLAGAARLVKAYPEFLARMNGSNVLVWKDGTETAYDDGIPKADYQDVLDRASLKDQMSVEYPAGWPFVAPSKDFDPGRIRNGPFFLKMYGNSEAEVRKRLQAVQWATTSQKEGAVLFSSVNGAAAALERVGAEIAKLSPDARAYVANPIGTFSWRTIEGTRRLSPHSFGIAMDFQLPKGLTHYWKWESKESSQSGTYPAAVLEDQRLGQVVQAFEKHGFIWGGKWSHYDTMHFEFRPELFVREGRTNTE
ncbi:MAG: M15 family metallopeptidase [Candidatus Hydrogenedentes bacterium]|nr:M15 family metallopeptidase [Candidatus Hydrogenedentota bacterium]